MAAQRSIRCGVCGTTGLDLSLFQDFSVKTCCEGLHETELHSSHKSQNGWKIDHSIRISAKRNFYQYTVKGVRLALDNWDKVLQNMSAQCTSLSEVPISSFWALCPVGILGRWSVGRLSRFNRRAPFQKQK